MTVKVIIGSGLLDQDTKWILRVAQARATWICPPDHAIDASLLLGVMIDCPKSAAGSVMRALAGLPEAIELAPFESWPEVFELVVTPEVMGLLGQMMQMALQEDAPKVTAAHLLKAMVWACNCDPAIHTELTAELLRLFQDELPTVSELNNFLTAVGK